MFDEEMPLPRATPFLRHGCSAVDATFRPGLTGSAETLWRGTG